MKPAIETIDLVGVQGGVDTHLGKGVMPPEMKFPALARSYFGFDEDDRESAVGMMTDLVAWMRNQGWRSPPLLVRPGVPTTYEHRFAEGVRLIVGAIPPADMVGEWIENVEVNGEHRLQAWVQSQPGTPEWVQATAVLDAAHQLAYNPEEGADHEVPKGHLVFVPEGYVVVKREDEQA